MFLLVLRHYEKSEPEIIHRPEVDQILELAALEDHDVTNQYTALGSVKPNWFRRGLFPVLLWLIDYFARHVYRRGHLGRIRTIHFARWVFLDGKKRMIFASNYDGSHEAYMDDFINKAGWGLNLAFNCGLGYPRTRWIIKDGIDDELKFKYTQRRHQMPTETWYRAYPGLTVYDIERNARVRAGFERRDDDRRRGSRVAVGPVRGRPMQLSDDDYRDIQGLVRFGYKHLEAARFHLLTIADAAAARAWLSKAPVTTAVKGRRPDAALQVAFTYEGLQRLGGAANTLAQFPYEFKSGMTEASRARRLGDVAANDPRWWLWGGPGKLPHVLVLLYAVTPDRLDEWEKELKTSSGRPRLRR